VVSATDSYDHILGFLDWSRYCFFQVAPQLYSRGWVDPVPDFSENLVAPGLEPDLWICSQELWPLDYRGCQHLCIAIIKQKPATMGGRTTHWTLSPKRLLYQLGLTNSPICERCLEGRESGTHILWECEASTNLRFRHLVHYFIEPADHHDAPIRKILLFIRSVGLIKKRRRRRRRRRRKGNKTDLKGRSARAGSILALPLYIHTYILTYLLTPWP
jgi:hypothetical protein